MNKPLAIIVEDEEDLRTVFTMALMRLGFDTITFDDGAKAVAYDGNLVALILLDYHLPHLSGLEVLEKWRENGRFQGVPVIMMTANHDLYHKFKKQVTKTLLKPLGVRELGEAIKSLNII